MASPSGGDNGPPQGVPQKQLMLWSKPIENTPGSDTTATNPDGTAAPPKRPTISDAVGSIKTEDFANVANTPCARNGFMTGILGATGVGSVKFLLSGSVAKSANWAVGLFLLGGTLSYEYCQYQRRAERIRMKRTIEIVNEKRREQGKELAAEKEKLEAEQKAAQRRWYKFW